MKNVLILFGGNSFEHEISCNSVNFILKSINKTKFNFKLVGIDYNNEWYELQEYETIDKNWKDNNIKKIDNVIKYCKGFDIVLPMIHGNTAEDGKIQGMFELNNIKYVGCDSKTSLICYDKLLTKLFLQNYSIPQLPYIIYTDNIQIKNIEYPVIIKPCKSGSSIGINVAYNKHQLKKYIKVAKKYDDFVIIEKFIKNNIELECCILQNKKELIVSDVGEILNNGKWYDFNSKYNKKDNTAISKINNDLKSQIQKYSKYIFKVLKCKKLSRIDFLYDLTNNKLFFNEINTMPGFTETSMFPKLIMNNNITANELIDILLTD